MFIGTTVTLYAIAKIADTFFDVLATSIFWSVLVTTIAGVAAVVVIRMAGHTACIVFRIKQETLVVIECCRNPLYLIMALAAVPCNLFV
jgi:hypothetical protein